MLLSDRLCLRPWEEADLPGLQRLRNDPVLQARLLARARPSALDGVRRWVGERAQAHDSVFFVIARRHDGGLAGYLQYSGFDPLDRRAEMGICLAPGDQGQGFGSEALLLAEDYLHRLWSLRKVSLRVRADLGPAIRCYSRVGYAECGRLRDHVHIDGTWHDVVLMERLFALRTGLPG